MKALKPPIFSLFLLITFTFLYPINAGSSLTRSLSYPPQARFVYTPPNPYVNGTVTFDASASTPEGGTLISYEWNFGDTTPIVTEFDPITTHVYTKAGTYVVTLNVTDSEGSWCTTSKPVTISSVYGPTANFTYSPLQPFVNETITFNASSSISGWNGTTNPPIIEYKWNFSDGTPLVIESDPITPHIYRAGGNYIVTLNVTDTMGWWDTASQTIRVHTVELTVKTDKQKYYIQMDQIRIQGNLTLNGNPVADSLIALEVDNPNNWPLVIRTTQTGTGPISGAAVNITDLFLCDENGNPISYTKKDTALKYVSVTVKNIGNERLNPIITLNFYQNLYPFYNITFWNVPEFYPGDTSSARISFTIPSWVSLGNATVYANVLSGFPRVGGYPYAQERASTFRIVDPLDPSSETTITMTNQSPNTNGTYSLIFQIPPDAKQGNYTIHVSACYESHQVSNSTTIVVKLPGDVNGDGAVKFDDLFALAAAYGSKPGSPNWNPNCDFIEDGKVDFADLFILAAYYGRKA